MKYGIAIILTVGLLSACSSVKTTPEKESKTINQNIQPTPGRPNLTAPEVLTKVLDFLRYAQSPEDFRIETVEKVMKMKFAPYSKEEKSAWDFYAGNDFGNTGWGWWINFDLDKSGTMRLYFGDGGGGILLPHRFARWIWISSILCWCRRGLPIQGRDVWVSLSTAMKKNIRMATKQISKSFIRGKVQKKYCINASMKLLSIFSSRRHKT